MWNLGLRDWVGLRNQGQAEAWERTVVLLWLHRAAHTPVASMVLVMPGELCCLPKPLPGTSDPGTEELRELLMLCKDLLTKVQNHDSSFWHLPSPKAPKILHLPVEEHLTSIWQPARAWPFS